MRGDLFSLGPTTRHPKNPTAEIAALTLEGPFVRYAWERMLSLESLLEYSVFLLLGPFGRIQKRKRNRQEAGV